MLCLRKFVVAKKFNDKKGGVSKFSVENFLSHSAKKAVGEPFSLSFFSGIEKFMLQRVKSRLFVECFLSHSTETFCRGTRKPSVLCFRKFLVAI